MGGIINDFHRARLCELMRDHEGNVVIGNPNAHDDKNLTPTVILNPDMDSPLMRDEIFGPILPVIQFKTIGDAIKIVQKQEKPLTLYYFGKCCGANFKRVENETSSGSLVANETLF